MVEILLKEEEKSVEKDSQLDFSFPKKLKIRKRSEYKSLYRSHIRLNSEFFFLDYRINKNATYPRLAITISSKTAKAYLRNKFKRLIKEIFRLNRHRINKNLEIHIIAKKVSKNINYFELEKDFLNLLSTIN